MPKTLAPVKPVGYWIDLQGIQFDDGELHWIQAFPFGEYEHPLHGKIVMTPERAARFAANFHNGVRGTEIDIDYDHKTNDGRAAGWVKNAEVRDDGLYIAVSWTDAAKQAIAAGEYRYFSPEFADAWTHPKTGITHRDVLFGGGITNRPFLKDILPINMSEVIRLNTTGESVDPKELAKLLGLPEDTPEAEVMAALATRLSQTEGGEGGDGGGSGDGNGEGGEGTEGQPPGTEGTPPVTEPPGQEGSNADPIAASETQLKKLAETNPAIATMLAERDETRKRLAKLEASNRLSEVTIQLNELKTDKATIAPAVLEELKGIGVMLPKQLSDKVFAVVKKFVDGDAVIQLGEGPSSRPGSGGQSAAKRFEDKINAAMKADDKLSYADAAVAVAADEPELYDMYLAETAEGVTL